MSSHEKIIILDFGGQYAHLIASRIRREQVLAEIYNPDEVSLEVLGDETVKGIIFSGGPQSVYDEDSIRCDLGVFELGKPILGICYGHHFLAYGLGGEVTPPAHSREYGRADVSHTDDCPLFQDIPRHSVFWMSHGDSVTQLPEGFQTCASSQDCAEAAVWHPEKKFFGIQFHPEVTHSEYGIQLLKNFLSICEVHGDWTIEKFLEEHSEVLKEKIGKRNVVLFVSGGVDSTVSFAFLSKILGKDRVQGLFVDTGLLREGEVEFVEQSIRNIGADLTVMREAKTFLGNLKGKYEPEEKREIIGNTFLEVQQKYFAEHKLEDNVVLAQGTIYPDTIETGGTKNAAKIKTHHNRVPEIQKLIDEGKVIEPIADLYKDEVRSLGEALGLPHELVWRHPFPGPGLGVRILCNEEKVTNHKLVIEEFQDTEYQVLPIKSVGVQGDFRTYRHPAILNLQSGEAQRLGLEKLEKIATELINKNDQVNRVILPIQGHFHPVLCNMEQGSLTQERVHTLQRADHIVTSTLQEMGLYSEIWQFPVVLAPISFDHKGKESVVLRPIDSIDAMSASVGKLPWDFFEHVGEKILQDPLISAVFLDITSKPPGTIEWE